jgi:selenocysteine-specific elongation factor
MADNRPETSKQIILGTAGHIDHGKTSLIKALTGINTDRLIEEQRRGITIELGFAFLDLPGGQRVGIVDVPGHERFVKNMVAGATGIDIVAMVIAADEGVMPQTREHMEICELLGVRHGFVVLTKTDLVDEEWLELALEDIKGFTRGTFLENRPIIPVSSVTGKGLPDFIEILTRVCQDIPERSSSGLFRLPVDRVFTMKGFGTVITGTVISGQVRVGGNVMLYPSEVRAKVRGIQFHNQSVDAAKAGMRTAINFQGLEKTAVNRGDVLSEPGSLAPGYMLDVLFHFLKSNKKPVKTRTRVRFHSGTSEILGNLILLESGELQPGQTGLVQLRLDAAVALVKDDRFVIRSYSPVHTIGGGHVLNPLPKKHKGVKPHLIEGLKRLCGDSAEQTVIYHVENAGYEGISLSHLYIMTNLAEKPLQQILDKLLSRRVILQIDRENRIFLHGDNFEKLKIEILANLETYHRVNPLKPGMPKEELKSGFPSFVEEKSVNFVLTQSIKTGEIIQEEEMVRLKNHTVSLAQDQADVRKKILESYVQNGLTPPYFSDLCKDFNMDKAQVKDVLMTLVDEGLIIKIKEDLYFHGAAVEDLRNRMVDFLKQNKELSTPQFKEIAGVSRKFLIPLLEYFDARNVTIRVGDIRKLRGA